MRKKPALGYDFHSAYPVNKVILRVNTFRISLLITATLLFSFSAWAQATSQARPVDLVTTDKSASNDQHAPSSIELEMRAKRAIRYAEEEHKDHLERARELSELGTKLQTSFTTKKFLDREDAKRLNRLQKLAKQLRSKAGGSDSKVDMEMPPATLGAAICRIAESSQSLAKLVHDTPRQVVSTAVIDEANILLQLIELVRQFSR